MFKRVVWFGAGVATGAAGSVWATRKVRAQLDRARPSQIAAGAADAAGRMGEVVRAAVAEGRRVAADREVELRSRYDVTPRPRLRPVDGAHAAPPGR